MRLLLAATLALAAAPAFADSPEKPAKVWTTPTIMTASPITVGEVTDISDVEVRVFTLETFPTTLGTLARPVSDAHISSVDTPTTTPRAPRRTRPKDPSLKNPLNIVAAFVHGAAEENLQSARRSQRNTGIDYYRLDFD